MTTEQQTQEPSQAEIYSTWMIWPWSKLLCLELFRWKNIFLSSDSRIGRHFLSKGDFYVMTALSFKRFNLLFHENGVWTNKLKKQLLKSNGKQWLHRWLWPPKLFFPVYLGAFCSLQKPPPSCLGCGGGMSQQRCCRRINKVSMLLTTIQKTQSPVY